MSIVCKLVMKTRFIEAAHILLLPEIRSISLLGKRKYEHFKNCHNSIPDTTNTPCGKRQYKKVTFKDISSGSQINRNFLRSLYITNNISKQT